MADRKNRARELGPGVGSVANNTDNAYFVDNGDGTFCQAEAARLYVRQAGVWVAWDGAGGGAGGGGAATIADGADVAQGATTDLSSASTVVGILKAIKAAITGTLTTTTSWAAPQHVIVDTAPSTAVTGPLTDTQLRASAVPVSLATNTPDVSDRAARLVGVVSGAANVFHVDDNAASLTVDAPVGTPVWVRLSDGAAAFVGQKAMAASIPVVLASDQASIPVAATLAAETTKVIGTVNPPALTKGTQGANGWSVQDLKDAGRATIMWTAEFAFAQTAETLLTITESRDGAAVTTFTSKAVTSGKRLRITSALLEIETLGSGTAPQRAYLRCRFNTAGAATTSSPLQFVVSAVNSVAIVKSGAYAAQQFPDGIEFLGDGTKQIAFSLETPDWVTTTATGRAKITITAFEY